MSRGRWPGSTPASATITVYLSDEGQQLEQMDRQDAAHVVGKSMAPILPAVRVRDDVVVEGTP